MASRSSWWATGAGEHDHGGEVVEGPETDPDPGREPEHQGLLT